MSNNSIIEKRVRASLIVALILVAGVTGFFAYSYSQERGIASSQSRQISSLQGQVSTLESKVNADNGVISTLNSSLETQVTADNSTIHKLETESFLNFTVTDMKAVAGGDGNASVFLEIKNTGSLEISNASVFAEASMNGSRTSTATTSASFTPASISPGGSASVNFTVPSTGAKIFLSVTALGPSTAAVIEYFGLTTTLAVIA